MISRIADCRITDERITDCRSHCVFPGGLRPPRTAEKRLRRARRPRFVVAIGLSAHNDAETPRRGLLGRNFELFSAS
eukprot:1426631-Alexandrium_andersonii.AAC.1